MMKRLALAAACAATVALTGCATDGPTRGDDALVSTDYAFMLFGPAGMALEGTLGAQGARAYDGRTAVAAFPPELALTAEQRAAIAALREEFRDLHAADLDALREIFEQARAAHQAGATRAEVHAILQQAMPIRERLQAAVAALHEAILGVLTAEQRAWLEENRRRPPPPPPGPNGLGLTPEQHAAISALRAEFQAAQQADYEALRAIHEQARAAHAAGATPEEIRAILAAGEPIRDRMRARAEAFHEAVLALLTPEQREWYLRHRGGPGPGHGHGPGDTR